jgi:copper(I)-binding protein
VFVRSVDVSGKGYKIVARIDRNLGIAACVTALLLLVAAAVGGRALAAPPVPPAVSNAWIRLPVVAGRPAALYATIAGGAMADRLIAVEGPKPARFELHATKAENGVMRMVPLVGLPVNAGQKIEMKPGGMHVMVFSLPATKPDSRVPLTFVFEKAGRVVVSAHAMSATAPDMKAGEHAHH